MQTMERIELEKFISNPELIFEQWIVEKIIISGIEDNDPPITFENVMVFVNELGVFSSIVDEEGKLHQIPNERIVEIVRPKSFLPFWKRTQLAGIVDQLNQILTIERTFDSEDHRVGTS